MPEYLYPVHPFCEGTYLAQVGWFGNVSRTEVGNALSSIFICIWGVCGLYSSRDARAGLTIQVLNGSLVMVGVGSTLYHGTLFFGFGMLDSVPMTFIVAISAMSIGDEMLFELTDRRSRLRWLLGNSIVLVSLCYFFALVSLDGTNQNTLWRTLFMVPALLLLGLLSYVRYRHDYFIVGDAATCARAKLLLRSGAVSGLAAAIIWQVDENVCTHHSVYLFGHAWWHILIGHSAHMLFAFMSYLRASNYEKVPVITMYPRAMANVWPLLAVVRWQHMNIRYMSAVRDMRSKSIFFGKPQEYGHQFVTTHNLVVAQSMPNQLPHLDVPGVREPRRFSTAGMHYTTAAAVAAPAVAHTTDDGDGDGTVLPPRPPCDTRITISYASSSG